MAETEKLPEAGDRIPVEKIHVSEMNVRFGQPFGEDEKDRNLIENLRGGRIIEKFITRPEDDGFGVVVGRRRFLAKKASGVQTFTVGSDFLIEELSDEEAVEASWMENLGMFRKDMDCITRAEALNKRLSFGTSSLRGTARRWRIPVSTLSEWLKVLELTPNMQESTKNGLLIYSDALRLAKMQLGEEKQDQLAEILETEGYEAFQKEVERSSTGSLKRGMPKGLYKIDRITWDTRSRRDMDYYKTLTKAAEMGKVEVPEYIKNFLIKHIEKIKEETA